LVHNRLPSLDKLETVTRGAEFESEVDATMVGLTKRPISSWPIFIIPPGTKLVFGYESFQVDEYDSELVEGSHGLARDDDTSSCQNILDHAQAERKPEIVPIRHGQSLTLENDGDDRRDHVQIWSCRQIPHFHRSSVNVTVSAAVFCQTRLAL